MSGPIRLAGFFSGGASTLGQLYLATLPEMMLDGGTELALIIGSEEEAGGFDRLGRYGYTGPAAVCNPKSFTTPEAFGEELLRLLRLHKINWFGQYGWLPMTPENVIAEYPGINQHPQLATLFGGKGWYSLTPHAGAYEFAKLTRHRTAYPIAQLVHPEYDRGDLLAMTPVHILDNCPSPEALQKQVLPYEWLTQIEALRHIADCDGDVPPTLPCPINLTSGEALILGNVRTKTLVAFPHGKRKK